MTILFWMVVAAALLLFGWGIWSLPLQSHNEARRLVTLHEMLATRLWLTPMKNGLFYFEKPPLFYWLGAVVSLVTGSTAEWVLRLPSVLAALLTTGLLYRHVRTAMGRHAALFSALALVGSPFYVTYARRAEINVVFGMLCFAALVLFFDYLQSSRRRNLYASFCVLGLASLAKGPVALLFFLAPLIAYGLIRRERKVFIALVNPLGWLLFAAIGLSWFAYALYGIPDSPLRGVIAQDIVGKSVTAAHDPFYTYLVALLGAFAPWILILIYKPRRWLRWPVSPPTLFALCAVITPLIIMSGFAAKHPKYMLPVVPFLAALLGGTVSTLYDRAVAAGGHRLPRVVTWGSAVLLTGLFIFITVAQPRACAYRYIVLKPFAARIHSLQGVHPVYAYHKEHAQLLLYHGGPMLPVDEHELAEKLTRGESFLLVARDDDTDLAEHAGLSLLESFSPYLKRNRAGVLYGSAAFCRDLNHAASGDKVSGITDVLTETAP